MPEPTDAEREQEIRKRNSRFATPDCQCAHCFLLRLLDAERARADAAEATVERIKKLFSGGPDTVCRTTWQNAYPTHPFDPLPIECVEVPMDELRAVLIDEPERHL